MMKQNDKPIMMFATGFYSGYAPFAPGTFGTLAGLPLCALVSLLPHAAIFLFTIAFIIFAVWISERAEQLMGKKDPGAIVIDEMAGILVTMALMPFTITTACAGFILFRIFDILKLFPVKAIEESIGGGAGIVMDDLAAGIMAHVALRAMLIIGA